MASWKKVASGAAGAGGDFLGVEDVFGANVWLGNGRNRSINNGINFGTRYGGGSAEFKAGEKHYLHRTSDFSSNTDSKTATCSYWVYIEDADISYSIYNCRQPSTYNGFQATAASSAKAEFYATDSSGNVALSVSTPANVIEVGKWHHVLISFDLANSLGKIYVDDVDQTSFSTFTKNNYAIDFTVPNHYFGRYGWSDSGHLEGNIAHFYLDYTYRDLSTTSNRRLFIDSSGKPATGQASLNPKLYFTFTEDLTTNSGTGGDMGLPIITNSGSGTDHTNPADSRTPRIDTSFGPDDSDEEGHGGMVLEFYRNSGAYDPQFFDTARGGTTGPYYKLASNNPYGQGNDTNQIEGFNAHGYQVGDEASINRLTSPIGEYLGYSFRNCPKFFDCVTWTGNSTSGRTISHNLGSTPGMVFIKRYDSSANQNWEVWHRSLASNKKLILNLQNAQGNGADITAVSDTTITISNSFTVNGNGASYVAYIFAHNNGDGGFGPTGDQDIIKCGIYTGNSSAFPTIDLGFEPQWILVKNITSGSTQWVVKSSKTGWNGVGISNGGRKIRLAQNGNAEDGDNILGIIPNGFQFSDWSTELNTDSNDYVYMAIRRGPMALPTSGADVFTATYGASTAIQPPAWSAPDNFTVDMSFDKNVGGGSTDNVTWMMRLANNKYTDQLVNASGNFWYNWAGASFDHDNGFRETNNGTSDLGYMWARRTGAFDVAAWKATGNDITVPHNLGGEVGMMWVTDLDYTKLTFVYARPVGNTHSARLNEHDSFSQTGHWADTHPTNTHFTVDSAIQVSGNHYLAALFGNLDGISKVGTFTGNGSNQNIDCGFTNGIRLLMMKKTNSTGGWWFWDEANLSANNQPMWRLDANQTGLTQNQDTIDYYSAGFNVKYNTYQSLNNNGDTYLFYAVAA